MKIVKVGIIGAGQMGCGIAQVCAAAGYQVGLNDVSVERIASGLATIDANLARRVKSGKTTPEDKAAALAKINAISSYEGFADFDLVIESAPPARPAQASRCARRSYRMRCSAA